MSGTECIVYEDLSKACKLLCEFGIVLLFLLGEASVLQQNDVAGLHSSNLSLCVLANGVVCEYNAAAKQLVKLISNNLQGELLYVALCLFKRCSGSSFSLSLRQLFDLSDLLLVQLELLVKYVVGLAHVRAQDHHSALLLEVLDGRQSLYDSLLRGDHAVLNGYVEVATNQTLLAGNVDVFNILLVVSHGCIPPFTNKFFHLIL